MCRNIKTLHNFKPPATDDEIRASALQFVRKLSGFTRPSKANQPAFERAVDEVARIARHAHNRHATSESRRRGGEGARQSRSAVPPDCERCHLRGAGRRCARVTL
jgi:hypothetical protein